MKNFKIWKETHRGTQSVISH